MKKTLSIIDTYGFFFSSFYAMPPLKSSQGFPTGLLTGFVKFIGTLRDDLHSDYIVFALDSGKGNFRKDIDPNYKANRSPAPEDLITQLPIAIDLIKEMGFKSIEADKFEADDIIATLVEKFKDEFDIKIITYDKDLYQLIEKDSVQVFHPRLKKFFNESACKEKFGVNPVQIHDYLSIVGDSVDNIPGIRGIGPKGAVNLLNEFESLEGIYENIEKVPNIRNQNLLKEYKDDAFLSYKLAGLVKDIDFDISASDMDIPDEPVEKASDILAKYDIRVGLRNPPRKQEIHVFEAVLLDTKEKLFEVISKIPSSSVVAFDTETSSLDVKDARIVGFSFSYETNRAYYVPIAHSYLGVGDQLSIDDCKHALKELFKHKIVGQNLKYDLAIVENNFDISFDIESDTMINSWLINPGRSHSLDNQAKREFNYDMVKFKDVVKKGEDFSSVDITDATKYAAEDAWMTLKLYDKLKLDERLQKISNEVEMPFIKTLRYMESCGIKADVGFLEYLGKKLDVSLSNLRNDICAISGEEFNVNSPKQLGIVLFDKLALKGVKSKSTNEKVLQSLKDKHEIIPKILEYRELHKLDSTYIKPLIKYAQKDQNSRIFTSFLHTGTVTGRLSSKDPNLQNIPVRKGMGKQIRKAFVSKEGYKLLALDYSQIELRLLAHFSEDKELVTAFNEGKDIHTQSAVKIFGEDEAKDKRNVAKAVNFGLIYGMGPKKLSETIHVSMNEAREYIKQYFEAFGSVKGYISSVHEAVQEVGYVSTILGRRRYFDFASANPMLQAGFLRDSVNTIFQGSSSDIIKLAMNEVYGLCQNNNEIDMLLQIHDELIFEVKEDKVDEYSNKIKDIMENVLKLKVPLIVSSKSGDNWGELD